LAPPPLSDSLLPLFRRLASTLLCLRHARMLGAAGSTSTSPARSTPRALLLFLVAVVRAHARAPHRARLLGILAAKLVALRPRHYRPPSARTSGMSLLSSACKLTPCASPHRRHVLQNVALVRVLAAPS
jgi:hypothetical protein